MAKLTLEIKIDGLDRLVKALERFPDVSMKNMDNGIKESIFEIEREAKLRTPVDTGVLRNSFQSNFKPLQGQVGPSVDYAIYVHQGTRPHWPPFQKGSALARWSQLHGVSAFLVARKISRKGTKAKPFLFDGAKASLPQIKKHMEAAVADTIKEIADKAK